MTATTAPAPGATTTRTELAEPARPTRRIPRATSVGEVLAWTAAVLLMGAAGIHFAVMGEHAGVSWSHGVFFGVVAWLQVALAVAIVLRRNRAVCLAVIAVNLAVLGVWVATRTVGISIGSDGTPEAWGRVDGVGAALEGLAVLATAGLLLPRLARRPLSARVGLAGAAFVGVLVAVLVTFVFSPAGVSGGATTAADGHNHGGATPVSADGDVHGAAAPVGQGHTHGVTTLNGQAVKGVKAKDVAAESQPDQPLDPATRATLAAQLVTARAVAEQFPTVASATAAGYHLAGGFAPGSGAHYIGPFSLTFDPSKPMSLIYAGTNPTSQITGLMYYGIGDTAPEGFAGPNDHWHRHSNVCIKGGLGGSLDTPFPADADVTAAQCAAVGGNLMKVTGWMVHAWVVPTWESPLGVFSHDNPNVRCADGTYKTDKAGFCTGV